MQKRRVMLDGAIVGAALIGDLQLKHSEVRLVRKALLGIGGTEIGRETSATVTYKSGLQVTLRPDYHHQKNKFFLSISGNPLTFLKGNNRYGYAEADKVIVAAFGKALAMIPGIPQRLHSLVSNMELNIHSLEFAAYTHAVPNKARLLNDWAAVYQFSFAKQEKDGVDEHWALTDLLNIKFVRKDAAYRSSVALRILSGDGREDEMMILAYDKAKQIREVAAKEAKARGIVIDTTTLMSLVPSDIEDRIRIDLHLCRGWFRRRQVAGRKLKTLRDLSLYVANNHEGDWAAFLALHFETALRKTMLFSMWSYDVAAQRGTKVYDAINKMRLTLRADDEEWNTVVIDRSTFRSLNVNPHPERLELDMSVKEKK